MKKINQDLIVNIARLVLVVVIVFAIGFYIGSNKNASGSFSTNNAEGNGTVEEVDFTSFWRVWSVIDKKHPEASSVDSKTRIFGAISGLVDSLDDPHSAFLNEEETKIFTEDISGNFSGVGMEIAIKDRVLTVVSPLKDTPAYRAGIKAGDKIIRIDGESTEGITVDGAVQLIRGEKGTEVVLDIYREGENETKEIAVIRDTIQIPTLDTELREDNIFVIKLYSFTANSTKLFRNAIGEFVNSKSDKLLLDLRGNPGGYLEAAVDISSWFLPTGKTIVIEDYGTNQEQKKYRSEGYNLFNENLKFVILIDQGSASASEIVAGAMQDYDKAKLVGQKSFGKGSVQEVVKITKDTILKITIAKWLTPGGVSISDAGLTPDFEVSISKEDIEQERDPQLEKAVEILNNWNK